MALSEERKAVLIEALRGHNVTTENITEEYMINAELSEREEINLETESGTIKAYKFTAKNRIPNCPLHINVHGGGFVRPHALRDELWSSKLADAIQGIVIDVDYPLAPEHPYPAAFNLTYELVKYIFASAGEMDVDSKRISMGGHSAGGNLTAAVALKANKTGDFKLCLQVMDYAVLDMATDQASKPAAEGNLIPSERGRMFNEAYTDGDLSKTKEIYCSPLLASDEDLAGLPDALIISAGKDMFRFEDTEYARRMALAGVRVTTKCYTESNHGFTIHCTGDWEEAQDLIISEVKRAAL